MADDQPSRRNSSSRPGDPDGPDREIDPAVAEKIIALETRVAFQDHLLANLDEVLRDFTRRVQDLELVLRELRTTVSDLDDPGPADQPPPHY